MWAAFLFVGFLRIGGSNSRKVEKKNTNTFVVALRSKSGFSVFFSFFFGGFLKKTEEEEGGGCEEEEGGSFSFSFNPSSFTFTSLLQGGQAFKHTHRKVKRGWGDLS